MSSAGIINFIYNETLVSRDLPSLSVDYNWFTGINIWNVRSTKQRPRNYSLVINKIYNSSRRYTLFYCQLSNVNQTFKQKIFFFFFLVFFKEWLIFLSGKKIFRVLVKIKYRKKNRFSLRLLIFRKNFDVLPKNTWWTPWKIWCFIIWNFIFYYTWAAFYQFNFIGQESKRIKNDAFFNKIATDSP